MWYLLIAGLKKSCSVFSVTQEEKNTHTSHTECIVGHKIFKRICCMFFCWSDGWIQWGIAYCLNRSGTFVTSPAPGKPEKRTCPNSTVTWWLTAVKIKYLPSTSFFSSGKQFWGWKVLKATCCLFVFSLALRYRFYDTTLKISVGPDHTRLWHMVQ